MILNGALAAKTRNVAGGVAGIDSNSSLYGAVLNTQALMVLPISCWDSTAAIQSGRVSVKFNVANFQICDGATYISLQATTQASVTATAGTKMTVTSGQTMLYYAAAFSTAGTYFKDYVVVAGFADLTSNQVGMSPLQYAWKNIPQNGEIDVPFFVPTSSKVKIRLKGNFGNGAGNYGIITLKIDGSAVGTIDFWAATVQENSVTTAATVTQGQHTLALVVATKNAGSGTYEVWLEELLVETSP